MAKSMFDESVKPGGRDAVLISLASFSSLLEANFAKEELRQHKDRINKIVAGELLATGATKAAIDAVKTALMIATLIPVLTVVTTSGSR